MRTTKKFIHEAAYRGDEAIEKLSLIHITIAGAGALGSNLADMLTRQGFTKLRLIDFDRVEEQNLGTQIYRCEDIGALKVNAAQQIVFQNVEVEIETLSKEFNLKNAKKLLKGTGLVVDAFDNHSSRKSISEFCRDQDIPCLHLGMIDGYGEIVWNEEYRIPNDADNDICDYPLARNLAILTASIAAEEIVDFALSSTPRKENRSITLRDLNISIR